MGRLGWSANCGCRPLSLITSADMADVLFVAHRYEESIQQSRKAFDMDPNFAIARFELGQVLAQRKMYKEAIEELQKAVELSGGGATCISSSPTYCALSGRRKEALNS
jgi:tetratricopeptide (TPR) repeat protein